MWEYILGGASLFALIVGLFAIYNGRATRKMLMEEEEATRELMERISKELGGKMDRGFTVMDERFVQMDKRFAKMDERFAKMDERFNALMKSVEAYIKISTEQHAEMLRRL